VRILLIETAPADRPGSMHRYADMISEALANESTIQVSRTSLAPKATDLARYPRRLRMAIHHATVIRRAMSIARKTPADVYHLVDGSHGYVARWLPQKRSVVTIHDIIPHLQSQRRFQTPPPSRGAQWLIRTCISSLNNATCLMADSHATAQDVVTANPDLADRLNVVPLTIAAIMQPRPETTLPDWDARRQHDPPYLLHLGNNGFYKNRAGVVRIFDRIRSDNVCRLIMAGPPPDAGLQSAIRERMITEYVDFVIDPSDAEICSLYRSARLLLFPSYYEGFGWPPLEAMAWGCPVVCSHEGSLAEVAGDAALTADVEDEEKLAAHVLSVLTDRAVADRLVTAGFSQIQRFSLAQFRESLLKVYRSLV
jgi:glycosyltransferase involved in cell wall biosynthesis